MSRKFIAYVLSAALAVTGMSATGARADDDDIAKWIAGAALAAIIGGVIAEQNDEPKIYWSHDTHQKPRVKSWGHKPRHGHLQSCKHRHGKFGLHRHTNIRSNHCQVVRDRKHGHIPEGHYGHSNQHTHNGLKGHGGHKPKHGHGSHKPKHGHGHGQGHVPYVNNQNHTGHVPSRGLDTHGLGLLLNSRLLPGKCMVTRNLHGQTFYGFPRHCLQKNNVDARALPQQCKVALRDHRTGQRRVFFGAQCLHKAGYRLAHGS